MIDNKNNQRRAWSEAEDQTLRRLYEDTGANKWALIAQRLQAEGFPGRSGKQCRERYNNQLDPLVSREEWSFQEEKKLYRLHDELGNRWAVISQRLNPARTDNSIKNHFYSRLRKSLRRINRLIHLKFKKQLREIQSKVLYKIIEASQEKFKPEPMCDPEVTEYSTILKNKILMFSYEEQEQQDDDASRSLIQEIIDFNRNYKRKPKKLRKIHSLLPEDQDQQEASFMPYQAEEEAEDEQGEDEENDENLNGEHKLGEKGLLVKVQTQQQKLIKPIILTANPTPNDPKARNQQMLEALGLLQDDLSMPHPIFMHKTASVMSSEHSQEQQEFKFFEDSEAQMRILATPLLTTVKRESMEDRLFQ